MSKRARRISAKDLVPAPKPQKYRSRSVTAFGHTFQSAHERDVYFERRQWLREGRIEKLELQPRFALVIGGVPIRYENGRQMCYIADFAYDRAETGEHVVEDAKSEITRKKEAYRIKKQLMAAMGILIHEV